MKKALNHINRDQAGLLFKDENLILSTLPQSSKEPKSVSSKVQDTPSLLSIDDTTSQSIQGIVMSRILFVKSYYEGPPQHAAKRHHALEL